MRISELATFEIRNSRTGQRQTWAPKRCQDSETPPASKIERLKASIKEFRPYQEVSMPLELSFQAKFLLTGIVAIITAFFTI